MRFARTKNPKSYFGRITLLKKLFWLYFLLLIFEGALRKWVAPQLSAPLLIIRDPVGLLIIWEAFRTKKWPHRWSAALAILAVVLVGIFALQLVRADNSMIVGLYGLRSYLLPFPVLLIMGENLDEEDLRRMGSFTLWILVPMALLEVGQYATPTNSFLNRGAYEGGEQIGYVYGHVRASGTFSFAVGAIGFGVLSAAFIFYGLVKKGVFATWLLWVDALAFIVSIPMVGSRGFVMELAELLVCVALGAMMGIAQFGRALRIILPVLLLSFLTSFLPVFSNAMGSLTERFQEGRAIEGGGSQERVVVARLVTPLVNTVEELDFTSQWWGVGIGRGAIAVQALLHGNEEATLGEDLYHREFGEMGPYAGMAYELFKLWLAIVVLGKALAAARDNEPLALLMIPLALTGLLLSSPEQPSEGGFMVIGMAFCIAASKLRAPVEQAVFSLANYREQVLAQRRLRSTGMSSQRFSHRQLRRPEPPGSTEQP